MGAALLVAIEGFYGPPACLPAHKTDQGRCNELGHRHGASVRTSPSAPTPYSTCETPSAWTCRPALGHGLHCRRICLPDRRNRRVVTPRPVVPQHCSEALRSGPSHHLVPYGWLVPSCRAGAGTAAAGL